MVGLDSLEGTRWVLSLSRGMIGLALLVISFTIPPEKIIGIWILELCVVPGGLYLEAMLSSQSPRQQLCYLVFCCPLNAWVVCSATGFAVSSCLDIAWSVSGNLRRISWVSDLLPLLFVFLNLN